MKLASEKVWDLTRELTRRRKSTVAIAGTINEAAKKLVKLQEVVRTIKDIFQLSEKSG